MSEFPRSLRDGMIARRVGDHTIVRTPDHAVHRLDDVAAWVWQHADGSRSVAQLTDELAAEVPTADRALVFEALDRLADAGLLSRRVAPPAGLSRRVLLERLAGASAIAALTAAVGLPRAAWAEGLCADEKDLVSTIALLEAEEETVAAYLEDWTDEAIDAEEPDKYLIEELSAREATHKKAGATYGVKRENAESDLAECKGAKKKVNLEAREQTRKAQFKKRKEKLEEQAVKSVQRYEKRVDKRAAQEEKAKQKLSTKEQHQKQVHKKWDDEQHQKSKSLSQEKKEKSAGRLQDRLKHAEQHHKQRTAVGEQRQKQLKSTEEQSYKKLDSKLVSSEETAKMQADKYSAVQYEEASKAAGSDDHLLERAQEEMLKAQAASEQKYKFEAKAEEQKIKGETAAEQKTKQASEQDAKASELKVEQSAKKAEEQKAKQASEQDLKS